MDRQEVSKLLNRYPFVSLNYAAKAIATVLPPSEAETLLAKYRLFQTAKKNMRTKMAASDIARNGRLLQFCSREWRANRDVVMSATRNYGLALAFAGEGLKNDREIVREAITENPISLIYASPALIADSELLDIVIRGFSEHAEDVERKFSSTPSAHWMMGEKRERECFMRTWENAIKILIIKLHGSAHMKTFFLNAIPIYSNIVKLAPPEIRRDPEIVEVLNSLGGR